MTTTTATTTTETTTTTTETTITETTTTTLTTTTLRPTPDFNVTFDSKEALAEGYEIMQNVLEQNCFTDMELFQAILDDRLRLVNADTYEALSFTAENIENANYPIHLYLWLNKPEGDLCRIEPPPSSNANFVNTGLWVLSALMSLLLW